MALESRDLVRSCDKLKILYVHYQNAYGHETWQDGYLLWGAPEHNDTGPLDHVAFQNHVTNYSTSKVSIDTKLDGGLPSWAPIYKAK